MEADGSSVSVAVNLLHFPVTTQDIEHLGGYGSMLWIALGKLRLKLTPSLMLKPPASNALIFILCGSDRFFYF